MLSQTVESIDGFALAKLADLERDKLYRSLKPTHRTPNARATRGGTELISFSDNDYLGLSQDPRVKKAAADAALRYGAGSGASRLVTGDCPLYAALESALARMKKTEAALVFGSGYLANVSTIPTLVGPGDLIVLDELSHSCLFAGARLSGAQIETFRHNDVEDAKRLLALPCDGRRLLLTETIFSMDGDLAPLAELQMACTEAGAWMMTDDAHGFGVIESDNAAPIQMGTLSKAAGSYGGYVCGPRSLVELLVNRARGLIYTTGLPPAALGASIAALEIIDHEPQRAVKAMENAALFCELIGAPPPESVIVPVILGDETVALDASERLLAQGLLVTAIRPPTVPPGTARLRISFSTDHKTVDIRKLAEATNQILGQSKRTAP